MNILKTTLLMALLTILLALVGEAISGQGVMTAAFLLAGGMSFFSYGFSDKIVLRMYGAQQDNPRFYGMVQRLEDTSRTHDY